MAFFKFRARGPRGDEQPASPAETIDDMRRRARHRLIGATVLVLAGVLGFPLLFDSQPRPIQVDIPFDIPDRDKVQPPGAKAAGKIAQAAPEAAAASGTVAADASLNAKEEVVSPTLPVPAARGEAKADAKAEARAEARTEPKAEPRHETKAETKAEAKASAPGPAPAVDSGARARALLDGKMAAPSAVPASAADPSGRFVVQVGAFADADKARETRQRLERAGLKTYTQEVQTKEGARIRVRVGPYGVRAEADKAAERIKALGLPASVLTL